MVKYLTEYLVSCRYTDSAKIVHAVIRVQENDTYWIYGTSCVFSFIASSEALQGSEIPINCIGCLAMGSPRLK